VEKLISNTYELTTISLFGLFLIICSIPLICREFILGLFFLGGGLMLIGIDFIIVNDALIFSFRSCLE